MVKAIWLVIVMCVVSLTLVVAQENRKEKSKQNGSDTTRNMNWVHRSSEDSTERSITLRNNVDFNDDYTDVTDMSVGGYFAVKTVEGGVTRELEITRGANGELQRRYAVEGAVRTYDDEARSWLARVLNEALRSGFDAKGRAEKILSKQGVEGILDEASRMRSDYVKRIYFTTALGASNSGDDIALRVLRQAARQLSSDYEKAQLLSRISKFDFGSEQLREAFAEAMQGMSSDYERGRAMSTLLRQHGANAEVQLLVVRSAAKLSSDYEKAKNLVKVARLNSTNERVRAALTDAAQKITSEYERGRVLAVLATKRRL